MFELVLLAFVAGVGRRRGEQPSCWACSRWPHRLAVIMVQTPPRSPSPTGSWASSSPGWSAERSPTTPNSRPSSTPRRELAGQALLAERRRIARDVHDFVGHGLAAGDAPGDERPARASPRPGRRRGRATLGRGGGPSKHAGASSHGHAPPQRRRDRGGAAASVRRRDLPLVDQARAAGLAVELHVQGDLFRVPPVIGLAVYRIAQEALANAARHAPRARTILGLELTDGRIAFVAETTGP